MRMKTTIVWIYSKDFFRKKSLPNFCKFANGGGNKFVFLLHCWGVSREAWFLNLKV
jgi:hypothetical protein